MLKVSVGHAEGIDTLDSITNVIAQCCNKMGSYNPTAGIITAGIDIKNRGKIDMYFVDEVK